MYKLDNENLKKLNFNEKNRYNIPKIIGIKKPINSIDFIGFNYCKSQASKLQTKYGIHFFLDDYQFNRLWNSPDKYIPILQKFEYVLSPDFSLYRDYPKAIQLYKHYQKHWLGAYWELFGIKVIPTICWSDHESFKWCFDGEPKNSIVAISSIGTQRDKISKQLFVDGYNEMIKKLKPKQILFWGNIPSELDKTNIKYMGYTMDEKFKLMRNNNS